MVYSNRIHIVAYHMVSSLCFNFKRIYYALKMGQNGFYFLSGVCVFSMVINIIISGFVFFIFIPIISVAILYFILHIKKNGIKYWDAMDMKRISR